MAVPVARRDGPGLRAGRDQGRQGQLLDRLAEVALRAERPCRAARRAAGRRCTCIWQTGPGSYGRNDADDCAADAAVLAKAVGKPVRLQYMREQGTGWDPKGPASIHRARAAIDAQGNVIAYEFLSKGFSRVDVNTNGSKLLDTLAGHTLGVALEVRRRLRRAGGILRVRQQADGLGDDPAAARSLVAAAHVASARSGRAADPLRQRIVHGRGGGGAQPGPDRVPAEAHQGPARHGADQGARRRSSAGTRGRRRARTRPATRCPGAASPMRSATAPASR